MDVVDPKRRKRSSNLFFLYRKLLKHFGRQHWWPAERDFEIIVGAILTQQTAWKNVEKAISNLRRLGMIDVESLAEANLKQIEKLVRPTGFFKQKAKRLKDVSEYFHEKGLKPLFNKNLNEIRDELLSLNGIGPETADSILLYVANRKTFVVDAYTKRILKRIGLIEDLGYDSIKSFCESSLPDNVETYKEFHALLVELGKNFCRTKPECESCPVNDSCEKKL